MVPGPRACNSGVKPGIEVKELVPGGGTMRLGNEMRRPGIVAFLAMLTVGSSALAQPWSRSRAVGLGPLQLRPQSPTTLLRYAPTPLPPVTLRRGEWMVGSVVNWDNYFAYSPERYILDAEAVGLTLGASIGVTERLDVSLSLPVSYRGGGVLDGFIEGFERSIGVPNEERRLRPRDEYLVRVVGPDGEVLERSGDDAGWGLEDANLAIRWQLMPGSETRPALLAGLGVKIPTGRRSSLRSAGGVDLATGLSIGQKLGRFHLYGTAAVIRYDRVEIAGVSFHRTQWSLLAGVEYRLSPRTSWLVQWALVSGAAMDFGAFSASTNEVTLGFKRLLGPDLMFEMSVLENLFVFDNSPDVGFHLGLVWRHPG